MKKNVTIILLSCFLFGSPTQTFSDHGSQLTTNIETNSGGGLGDVGPPHARPEKGKEIEG